MRRLRLHRFALCGLLWVAGAAPAPAEPPQRTAVALTDTTADIPDAATAAVAAVPVGPKIRPRDWMASESAQCQAAIAVAQERYKLPANLLGSIALVESGRPIPSVGRVRPWPWAIDADGQAMFLDSKPAAVAWARLALKRGVRFMDIGCMQVNWQLHPGAFRSLEQAFDPAANADYAARYLRSLYQDAHGDWNVAVGWYHSHTLYLAADYRDRVATVGSGILTGIGGPEPLFRTAMRQGTLRLPMIGGGVLVLNVHRQPRPATARVMSRCRIAMTLAPMLPYRVQGC